MVDTKISLTPADSLRLAAGYNQNGIQTPGNPVEFQAAGAVKSTVKDMLSYIRYQLDEKNAVVKRSHEPMLAIRDGYTVGLNWNIQYFPGNRRVIWQDGNVPGSSSLCILYPDDNMGIIVFSNQTDQTTNHRLYVLAERIIRCFGSGIPAF